MKYLRNDSRWEVKSKCLHLLYQLAKPGPHLWPAGAIDNIIDFSLCAEKPEVLTLALRVIQVLTESPRMCHDYCDNDSKLKMLCRVNCYSTHPTITVQALQTMTQVLCYW